MEIGDVYITDLEPTIGHEQAKIRPCVIVSRPELNSLLGTVVIAPITSAIPDCEYPNVIIFEASEAGLPKKGAVKLEQVRCIDKSRLRKYLGTFNSVRIGQLQNALRTAFDL